MAQVVTTELVIDSDTSGADRFISKMDDSHAAAQRGVTANDNLALSIAGVSVGMIAAVVSIGKGIDYIVGLNKSLADLQTMAKQAGLSLADFQGIQFGGAVAGMTPEQINAGLQKSAQLLNDAQRNANSLSKEFEANNLSIKNANGQLISQNQLLGVAADLINRAKNPGDALAIAQMLGFTKEWIPLLEQGSSAMAGLTDEARRAGAVIDDETINKAAEFDAQWRKSSVEMSSYLRAALVGLLPYVDDLIQRLSKFLQSIDRTKIAAAAQEHADSALQNLRDAGVSESGGLKIGMTPEALAALRDFHDDSKSLWQQLVAAATALRGAVQYIPEQDVKWHAGTDPVMDTSSATMQAAKSTAGWLAEADAWKKLSADVATGAETMAGGFSKVASRGNDVNDHVDRAINTLRRHIEAQKADALAVGLGDGALAGFRAQAAETAAVQANGGKETAEQAAQFKKLRDEAIATADGLAKVKVASQIDFSNKTKFLSADDLAIAQQLKGIYGNDVPAAMASTEAAAIRVNNAIKEGKDFGIQFATTFVQGLMQGKSAMDALVASAANLANALANSAIKDLLSSDPTGVTQIKGAVEGIAAIGLSIFAGDQKAKAALQEAQAQWAAMSSDVQTFNLAKADDAKARPANDNQEKRKDPRRDRDQRSAAA